MDYFFSTAATFGCAGAATGFGAGVGWALAAGYAGLTGAFGATTGAFSGAFGAVTGAFGATIGAFGATTGAFGATTGVGTLAATAGAF